MDITSHSTTNTPYVFASNRRVKSYMYIMAYFRILFAFRLTLRLAFRLITIP